MSRARSEKQGKKRLGRVVVVEDDPVLAMAIQSALESVGTRQVVLCSSIASTMEALEQGSPDALVIDVHLSDRDDGWAIAELVDLLGPPRPSIVFSTGSPEDIPPEIAELGPIFAKPYDPAQLAAALMSGAKPGLFARLRGPRA